MIYLCTKILIRRNKWPSDKSFDSIYILSFFVHDSFDYWFISISNNYNPQSQELNLNQNVIFSDDRQTDLHHSNHLLCSISAFLTLIKENITDSEHTKEDFYFSLF